MISSNGKPRLSEKGLLTPDNCVVALIDHQPQMLFGVSNFDRQTIINNTVALAKATQVFDVPVVLTTVETKSFSGNIWPQIKAVFPNQDPIERAARRSSWLVSGPRSASPFRPFRQFKMATKYMSLKMPAEMLVNSITIT